MTTEDIVSFENCKAIMEAQNSTYDLVGNEVFAGDYIAIAQTQTKGGCPSIGIAQVKEVTIGKNGGVKIHFIPKDYCVSTLGNYLTSRFKFIKLNNFVPKETK